MDLFSSDPEDVGDVVVENGRNVTIKDPQDVFIERGVADEGVTVEQVGDAHVEGNEDFPSIHGDYVVDDGEDVTIDGCEDVLVKAGSVSGTLEVKNTMDDVFVLPGSDTEVVDPEDVFIKSGAVSESSFVELTGAEDVWFFSDSVDTVAEIVDSEDILLESSEAVGDVAAERSAGDTPGVRLVNCEDVFAETDAINGTVYATDFDDVVEDADVDFPL